MPTSRGRDGEASYRLVMEVRNTRRSVPGGGTRGSGGGQMHTRARPGHRPTKGVGSTVGESAWPLPIDGDAGSRCFPDSEGGTEVM